VSDPRADEIVLERECAVWCHYLIDAEPGHGVREGYLRAHRIGAVEQSGGASSFDRALVAFARRGPQFARFADAHARLFSASGLLRRKLVLALALLETDPDAHRRVELVSRGSRRGFIAAMTLWIAGFALAVVLGLFVFIPLRVVCALIGGSERAGSRA
jgi:hypothetical protein